MEGAEVLIPMVFFITVGAIWGLIALTRHKERMTMIEKGLKGEDIKSMYERGTMRINPLSSMKWGLVFTNVGIAILVGLWLRQNFNVDEGVYPGLIALLGGLGLMSFYKIASKKMKE